jgi:HlyD family secretion protein
MKRVVIIVIVVLVLVGGWFAFRRFRAQQQAVAASIYQTEAASRGSLTATVGATGTVRANQTAILTWQTSGIVGDVKVAVGDLIEPQAALANIRPDSLPQSVILAQADLVSAQTNLKNLQDSNLGQAQAQKAVENAQQALDDLRNPQLSQAQASQAVADAQKAVDKAQQRVNSLKSKADQATIDAAQAQVVLAKNNLDKAQEAFDPYANKPADNLVRANLLAQLSAAQQSYDAAVRQLNNLLGNSNPTDLAVAEADLATTQAQLASAQREYDRVKNGPTAADIAVAEAQLADAQREWGRVQNGPNPDDIAAAQARVDAAKATLDTQRITAPFAGTVTEVDSKPGDQVNPGTTAFRLDDLSHLLLDAQISEVDINRIQVGQDALLTFDAIPNKEYHGVVTEVAAVGTSVQGVVDFTVTIELNDADASVKPGMTAAVNVVVNQLQDVLLVPNRAVRLSDSQRVVYVLQPGGGIKPVQIQLGASSDTVSEVTGGDLKVGDQIVLNPPNQFGQGGGARFVGP